MPFIKAPFGVQERFSFPLTTMAIVIRSSQSPTRHRPSLSSSVSDPCPQWGAHVLLACSSQCTSNMGSREGPCTGLCFLLTIAPVLERVPRHQYYKSIDSHFGALRRTARQSRCIHLRRSSAPVAESAAFTLHMYGERSSEAPPSQYAHVQLIRDCPCRP